MIFATLEQVQQCEHIIHLRIHNQPAASECNVQEKCHTTTIIIISYVIEH